MAVREACIIGAGSSGMVAAKVLHERGIPFVCFEKGSGIGGNWRYGNDNGMSAAYRSLRINTSRTRMAYSDFPMPDDYPDFATHDQVLDYFEAYVDHFGFRDHIRFRAEVVAVEPDGDGRWCVTVRNAEGVTARHVFGAVLIANGHHWHPNLPSFPGHFDGSTLHAHDYRVPEPYSGKKVLVVGVGNSGVDIACELADVASSVALSSRRGAHVIPKVVLGKPLDLWTNRLTGRLPFGVQRLLTETLLRLARGPQEPYGFPVPPNRLLEEHPTVSDHLLNLVRDGRVEPKPTIQAMEGSTVRFVDGSHEEFDAIIWATGYQVRFPFLDPQHVPTRGNRVRLYRFVVPPDTPNLYFIGLIQPLGAIMPLAELQAEWVADLLHGRAGLPNDESMRESIIATEQAMRSRYVSSPRHTLQVDFWPYASLMRRERRRGRRFEPNRKLPVQ